VFLVTHKTSSVIWTFENVLCCPFFNSLHYAVRFVRACLCKTTAAGSTRRGREAISRTYARMPSYRITLSLRTVSADFGVWIEIIASQMGNWREEHDGLTADGRRK